MLSIQDITDVGWVPDNRRKLGYGFTWGNDIYIILQLMNEENQVYSIHIHGETQLGTQGCVYWGIINDKQHLQQITENTGLKQCSMNNNKIELLDNKQVQSLAEVYAFWEVEISTTSSWEKFKEYLISKEKDIPYIITAYLSVKGTAIYKLMEDGYYRRNGYESIEGWLPEQFNNSTEQIYSIKRKSDNVEFSIGDKVCWDWAALSGGNTYCTIEKFEINQSGYSDNITLHAKWNEDNTTRNYDNIICTNWSFRHYVEPKKPLYTTHDGVEIFDSGRTVYGIDVTDKENCYNWNLINVLNLLENPKLDKNVKINWILWFSTPELREEYILNNTKVTINQLQDWFKEDLEPALVTQIVDLIKEKLNNNK